MKEYPTASITNQFPFPTFTYQLYVMKCIIFKRNIKSMISTKFHEVLKQLVGFHQYVSWAQGPENPNGK